MVANGLSLYQMKVSFLKILYKFSISFSSLSVVAHPLIEANPWADTFISSLSLADLNMISGEYILDKK